ncbi:MAG TPA: hypothetical protein PLE39_16330 [Anaerolineales bacterium]|nr:hypothetical protein [Anaerolineales bacterium]
MATKNQRTSRKTLDTKTLVTIVIAIIGVAGTIGAALITALFGFLSTKAQIELPISATQTAELKLATLTSEPSPSFTQTPASTSNMDWKNYLEIENNIQCNDIVVLPQGLDYLSSSIPEKISQAISQGYADQSIYSWDKVPEADKDMYNAQRASITIDINNIASEDWVEVTKSLTVSIGTEKEIPEKINAVRIGGGCGASGEIREFPPLNLATDFEQYTDKTIYPEFDFFKLENGEFERFQIPFTCQAPGYYQLAINIPFNIRNKASEMQTTANVICPNEISLWFYDLMGNRVIGTSESYFWNGNGYVSK